MHDTTFEQITENLKRALDIVENCGEAYKNASDTIKKLMNQAIFEKFYISNDADMEFKVDAEFKPPFDQILEPVKDDIIRINRLAQDCPSKLSYYIDIAKDHIQKIFGCGLYTINNSTNMSTYSNGSNFFSHNSSSKVLMVGLSETYSNNYKIIRDYVKNHASTPVDIDVDPAITDQSYNPDYIVKTIKQQQKVPTELETRTIIKRYQQGVSSYILAKEFGCHRSTITAALRRNGIEVSHKATTKPELVKRVIELYAEMKTPKEVGSIVGINEGTVRSILHDNNVYIRKSWEYPKK